MQYFVVVERERERETFKFKQKTIHPKVLTLYFSSLNIFHYFLSNVLQIWSKLLFVSKNFFVCSFVDVVLLFPQTFFFFEFTNLKFKFKIKTVRQIFRKVFVKMYTCIFDFN